MMYSAEISHNSPSVLQPIASQGRRGSKSDTGTPQRRLEEAVSAHATAESSSRATGDSLAGIQGATPSVTPVPRVRRKPRRVHHMYSFTFTRTLVKLATLGLLLRQSVAMDGQSVASRGLTITSKCEKGHPLKEHETPTGNYNCDVCKTKQAKGTTLWGCHPCNWDICRGCLETWKPTAAKRPNPKELQVTEIFCEAKHRLIPRYVTSADKYGVSCDGSTLCRGKKLHLGTLMMGCRKCNIDFCPRCYIRKLDNGTYAGKPTCTKKS